MTTETEGLILEELSTLKQRIAQLEHEIQMLKFHSPGTKYGPITATASPIKVCEKCTKIFSGSASYVCPETECPTFIKAR